MGSPFSSYSLRALETARQCVMLGARLRTIAKAAKVAVDYRIFGFNAFGTHLLLALVVAMLAALAYRW